MNKTTGFLLIVISVLCFTIVATKPSKADGRTFPGVVTFVTNNDRLGFFDRNSGKIYVYDNNINQCLFVGQIQDLGKPIQLITSKSMSSNNPAVL